MSITEHDVPTTTFAAAEPAATAPAPAPAPAADVFDTCDQCQAPLDEHQRYCVVCGTHRPNADDPVARYLASAKRARTAPPAPPAPARTAERARLAAAIALVPLAAALGVLVGRGDSGGDQQIIEALKVQKAPVVTVVGAGAAGGAVADTPTSGGTTSSTAAKTTGTDAAAPGAVLARTKYGTARKLEGSKITKQQVQESKQALKKIINSKGKEYVESQRNLPDQIVIP